MTRWPEPPPFSRVARFLYEAGKAQRNMDEDGGNAVFAALAFPTDDILPSVVIAMRLGEADD